MICSIFPPVPPSSAAQPQIPCINCTRNDPIVNSRVVESCRIRAEKSGYELAVIPGNYGKQKLARVRLTYSYRLPLLALEAHKTTDSTSRPICTCIFPLPLSENACSIFIQLAASGISKDRLDMQA